MMRQAQKVETFKHTQGLLDALHAKYDTNSGDVVVGDAEWGHLQIDATSLYILTLAQMTASGLKIIYTQDEVDFVQNLIFYIERAYRTPDYGIWERGNKINHGEAELNSSSIGMVVAALQAINGVNLFGAKGGPSSVIHVLPDEFTRNFNTLHSALPRESNSKEIDAAILSVIGFPAFAVADPNLVEKTRNEIISKLGGKYGCKRFLRDGHQSVLEDTSRGYYNAQELAVFEHVECEWPLFFTYLILDGLFSGDDELVERYKDAIEPLIIDSMEIDNFGECVGDPDAKAGRTPPRTPPLSPRVRDSIPLIPELYYVPKELIEAEKANPGSQMRMPNDNVPLVWANSLYILGDLIYDKLLSVSEIDPLGRRFNAQRTQYVDTVVQIALVAEDTALQAQLATYGLETQTFEQISPITISSPNALKEVYTTLGMNEKLGLSGRPGHPIGTLSTSKIYRVQGKLHTFIPSFMDKEKFYLSSDNEYLVSVFEHELSFVQKHWFYPGRPTMTILLTHEMFNGEQLPATSSLHLRSDTKDQRMWRRNSLESNSRRNLMNFMMTLRTGNCKGVRVKLGRLNELVSTSCIESLDFLVNKNQIDWQATLRGCKARDSEDRLRCNSSRRSSIRRKSICRAKSGIWSNSNLTTPLAQPENPVDGYFSFQKDSTIVEKDDSEDEVDSITLDMLALTLGDSAQVSAALSLLDSTTNIFDQVDLLHYLHSCHGCDFYIDSFAATVGALLEEIYKRALRSKLWGIVRQSAGLLKKSVGSLTVNLTDLVIRQKEVTIGSGENEIFIRSPLTPEALTDIIYSRSAGDVREASLVQEILTYLGSFMRADSGLFNGIMRLRTHCIIIALREEISRMKGCDEEDAVEQLIQLSPFELKSLLGTILSGPGLSEGGEERVSSQRKSTANHWHNVSLVEKLSKKPLLNISVQSGGYQDGNFSQILINEQPVNVSNRGLNVVALDPVEGLILEVASFDTHISERDSEDFVKLIEWLEPGSIVVLCAKDEFTEHLNLNAKLAIEGLGSITINDVKYRDSWCLIGEKGSAKGSAKEALQAAGTGSTAVLHATYDISARKSAGTLVASSQHGPSNGRWLNRRKNDGAFNRVPENFYPKVWKVLDHSRGIRIGCYFLPRDPTVSEKTPEEFNFALEVEKFLDCILDPAERQIAVECLLGVYKFVLQGGDMSAAEVDLIKIIHVSIQAFWDVWTREHEEDLRTLLPDLTFETNGVVARKIFFDLPRTGECSTETFIMKSIINL
ncbi:phosphorylase kinase alphabeta [Basidiobolus meristosporus CBS 931.73]|uniref:Phosphorylase kinase alphabeta n=1 Tax=Basidiobolus meristosporus CBS 931.73 TaxID=1314790 RepID=A0A1Y1Y6Z0_9FUNG|nr:phosphorylase kinase alphabeta [Basidiobolus meristosporus CBS 931.73]|eukprot:ORX93773.1 phosphorylase kinase alphabeta [Basidiobolus meristosporus CBS 931.73]